MPGLKHSTKKHFAKASTSKRSIQNGISAEYTEYRTNLARVVTAIKALLKHIQATPQVWAAVGKHQCTFSNALLQALPTEGVVKNHAHEVDNTTQQLQRMIAEDDEATTPHKKISSILESYLRLVESVQSDYPGVEISYTEVVRYQRKVDKLQKKGDKKKTALQRNLGKLSSARAEHEQKLRAALERMKTTYGKQEAVFQCAHHAFWIAQEKYSQIINDATRGIRWESMSVREVLMRIDVNKTQRLLPIQRVQMLMPPTSPTVINSTPLIEQPQPAVVVVPASSQGSVESQNEAPSELVTAVHSVSSAAHERPTSVTVGKSSDDGDAAKKNSVTQVVRLTPNKPSVSVALKSTETDTVKRVNSHGDVVYVTAPHVEGSQKPKPV